MRPSELNQSRLPAENAPYLELEEAEDGSVDVIFCQRPLHVKNTEYLVDGVAYAKILNVAPERITIWPVNTRPEKDDYLEPKYGTLEEIIVTRPVKSPYDLPETADDVVQLLSELPEGFSKQFQFGLGIHWEYRLICTTIAEIPDVTCLCIHGESGSHDAYIEAPFYTLGIKRFHEIRKELDRIVSRHQRAGLTDKRLLAYQGLLHSADQKRFPKKTKTLRNDGISEIATVAGEPAKLSKRDRRTVVSLVKENAEELAKTESRALLELKADIEKVTLKELISEFENKLGKTLDEGHWQSFFAMNPFILSLAFSVPVLFIQGNPYVGGKGLAGRQGKYPDFLYANAATGNLAIVEIKKPSTLLLAKTPYRDDVYPMSPDSSGAVVQVLDQRSQLYKNLANFKDDSDRNDIHAYSIRCIVLAGLTPQSKQEKKSFELARTAISDVAIITFDELLARLKAIYEALSGEDKQAQTGDGDIPF